MTLWAPVVYGRTATSDTWWRAVPEDLDQYGWLGEVVHSALADGLELERRPRFLFAQNATHRIVGVACQAGDLSDTMWTDGSRKLFCFVGWVAAGTAPPEPDVPGLADLEDGYRQWAGRVYRDRLGPVWEAPATAFLPPASTQPESAPWRAPARYPRPDLTLDKGAWAEDSWPVVWAAVQTTKDTVTCVIGWQRISSARFENATHIGVADAPPRQLPPGDYPAPAVISPVPAAPLRSAPPVPTAPLRSAPPPQPAQSPVSADRVGVRAGAAADSMSPTRPAAAPRPVVPAGDHGSSGVGLPPAPVVSERSWFGHLPDWAKLTAAAAAGALAAGLVVAVVSPSPAPAPVGRLVRLQVVLSASVRPVDGSLIDYGEDGKLSPGESAVGMAIWSRGSAGAASCASAVAEVPPHAPPIQAYQGLRLCVELNGNPSRYGLVEITSVPAATVAATVTLWP